MASSCARPPSTDWPLRSARCWCRYWRRPATAPARHRALGCVAMHQCERVGLDFIDSAPFRFVSTVDLTIMPEQVFEVLDDAESWPQWATAITKVTWTSPQPHGVGTTRTVNMRGGITGDVGVPPLAGESTLPGTLSRTWLSVSTRSRLAASRRSP